MNLHEINAEILERELEVESVPGMFVLIAKHQVMGLANEQIAEVLGAELVDVQECESDELYQRVKGFIGGVYAAQAADQTSGWDGIESIAIGQLLKRLPFERDGEFLLKVAAVANRATRKHQQMNNNVLDPSLRAGRSTITLTQRLVSKMNGRGGQETEETRQLSIRDGSMSNPSFAEIDSLLTVRNVPVIDQQLDIQTRTPEPNQADLLGDLMKRHKS